MLSQTLANGNSKNNNFNSRRELASRADQRVLRWFGHVERMDEYRTTRRVLMAKVSGERVLLLSLLEKAGNARLGGSD